MLWRAEEGDAVVCQHYGRVEHRDFDHRPVCALLQELGLSTTTGAFAAGVLLAGSQYRQQIEADIKKLQKNFIFIDTTAPSTTFV